MADRVATALRSRRLLLVSVAFSCAAAVEPLSAAPGSGGGPDGWQATAERAKPSKRGAARPPRRSGGRATPHSQPTSAPVAASEPAPPAGPETVGHARRRLARIPAQKRTAEENALLAALEFATAIGRADGRRAATLLEVVGYQPLPLSGDLPEPPAAVVLPADIERAIASRPPINPDDWPAEHFEVVPRSRLRAMFPAVADWMLPHDRAVVVHPVPQAEGWVSQDACVVVRIRAGKATIMGGNLLEALGLSLERAGSPGSGE